MSTVKITDLPVISTLNLDTTETIIPVVDLSTDETAQITVRTLADGMFHNDALKVGQNEILFSNTVAQFSGNGTPFLQVNHQNFDGNSSGDYVVTADIGTNANNFIDVGINGSTFSDPTYSAMQALDGYLFVQGSLDNSTNGNLIIGTASSGANVVVAAGGTTTENVVAHFTKNGLVFQNSAQLEFTDGSIQTVAAAPASLSQGAYNVANTASANTIIIQGVNVTQNTNITSVNQYAQSSFATANDANGMAVAAYGHANNSFDTANSALDLSIAAYDLANTALQNTSGTFAGDLTVTGNVTVIGTANTTVANLNVNKNVTVNGTMILANSNFSATESAVLISATPTVAVPSNDGYMLHISGKENVPSRIVFDSYGSGAYGLVAGRSARGTVASPTAVANNDVLMRVSGNGHGGAGAGWTTTGVARIDIVATENYSATNRGSQIQFWNCPIGSNTLQQIATFNGESVAFTGVVMPEKGFILTPNVISSNVTTHTINFAQDSLKKLQINADCTVTLTNYIAGKIVEVWVTNFSGLTRTFTHGCSALNSTTNATTVSIPGTSSARLKYFSIDGDNANTFVSITAA